MRLRPTSATEMERKTTFSMHPPRDTQANGPSLSRRARVLAILALTVALAAVAGGSANASPQGSTKLTIFAAASLTDVLPKIVSGPNYSFGGSNTLLAQIEQGAPADVFVSANTAYPNQLYTEGKCEKPAVFATNKLVVAIPKSNPGAIHSVFDLRRSGKRVVIASKGVPVGDYTRTLLANMGISKAVLANVVSNEPDVRSVLAKVALGEADAGFVYRTDVVAVKDKVSFIALPTWAQPPVRYAVCVLTRSSLKVGARTFVKVLLGDRGRATLAAALFGLPPKQA